MMLFCIGDDVIDYLISGNKISSDIIKIFKELDHMISSPNNDLTVESNKILKIGLSKFSTMDQSIKRVMHYCYENYVSKFGLTKVLSIVFVISISSKEDVDNKKYITIADIIKWKIDLSNRVALLCENVADCQFYTDLARKFKEFYPTNEAIGSNISFDFYQGAGNDISSVLEVVVKNNNKFVLSICDSDKKYDNHFPQSTTANILKEKISELKNEGYNQIGYYILNVHEIENLVAPSEYLLSSKNKGDSKRKFTKLLSIEKSSDVNLLCYFDYKEGIRKKFLKEQIFLDFDRKYPEVMLKNFKELGEESAVTINLGKKCFRYVDIENLNFSDSFFLYEERRKITKSIESWGINTPVSMII